MPATQSPFLSPLRYPGGKGKLANYLKLLLEINGLRDVRYVEPYAGGASVALSLLFEEYASHVDINDVNRSVYAFWYSVLNNTDELCRLISDVSVTVDEWFRQKDVQTAREASLLELGFSTFFLNRTNRSGIIAGGIIGGKKQTGAWKLDARFNKEELVKRIKKIARYSSRITLHHQDALQLLRELTPTLGENSLLYLDPPYYVKGEGLYEHFYQDRDHAEVAELVRGTTHPWVVSYDYHPRLLDLYSGFRHVEYQLSYSAQERYKGSELIFFAPGLRIPDVSSPAKLPLDSVVATTR
ncbi:MAG TPA: DNA adenine methylase [Longimicrobium sp.]